jgi:hypothetical protein
MFSLYSLLVASYKNFSFVDIDKGMWTCRSPRMTIPPLEREVSCFGIILSPWPLPSPFFHFVIVPSMLLILWWIWLQYFFIYPTTLLSLNYCNNWKSAYVLSCNWEHSFGVSLNSLIFQRRLIQMAWPLISVLIIFLYSLHLNICFGLTKEMNMLGTYEAGIIMLVPVLLPRPFACLLSVLIFCSTESCWVTWYPSTDTYILLDWIAVKELLCSS